MDSIRFLDFILQRRTRQLTRALDIVPIGARAFDPLDFLIAHRDRAVGRDEIMAAVWPDVMVGENNLNVQVANLRKLLGGEAILTVAGRGLRFGLAVETDEALDVPDQPSVVVLPFSNLGGDPNLEWFADGFVEDITTELSRFRDLFVIARKSALVYRQLPRDLHAITHELGLRYAVEGNMSIKTAGHGPTRPRSAPACHKPATVRAFSAA